MASFYIEQFGCRATQADGAAIERQLRERGYGAAADAAAADVVVVNTCTVTASADAQARAAVCEAGRRNPAARIIVTGCYAQRAERVRERLPSVAFGADVIAGFPSETEGDHAATLDFIRRLPFTYLHVFSYSKRPGTETARLSNEVPGGVVRRRARELRALSVEKAASFQRSHVGRSLRVLTLQPTEEGIRGGWSEALSSNYLRVRVSGCWPRNEFLDVRIDREGGDRLHGRAESESACEFAYASKMTCASA